MLRADGREYCRGLFGGKLANGASLNVNTWFDKLIFRVASAVAGNPASGCADYLVDQGAGNVTFKSARGAEVIKVPKIADKTMKRDATAIDRSQAQMLTGRTVDLRMAAVGGTIDSRVW
jgi:hypothetical protein